MRTIYLISLCWTSDTNISSVLDLHLYAKRNVRHDDLVGSTKETIKSLLADGTGGLSKQLHGVFPTLNVFSVAIARVLSKPNADKALSQTIIEFSISVGTQPSNASHMEMDDSVTKATTALGRIRMEPSTLGHAEGAVSTFTTISQKTTSTAASWDPLVQRIKLFTTIVDGISEVGRSAKLAANFPKIWLCRFTPMQRWLGAF
jgi:hypothetical protein